MRGCARARGGIFTGYSEFLAFASGIYTVAAQVLAARTIAWRDVIVVVLDPTVNAVALLLAPFAIRVVTRFG